MTSVVLVHGLFGHLNIPEVRNAFGKVQTSAPDLIGYGIHSEADVSKLSLVDQADHIISHILNSYDVPIHLLGHSVGGAVCALVANMRPDLIASLISVEGNFTLKNAFWSSQISNQTDAEVANIVEGYRADPDGWMNAAISNPSELTARMARAWLANQPASTIKAQARAVVAATSSDGYLSDLRKTMESSMPVHLIAGGLSSEGWDTPAWSAQLCSTRTNIPKTGHLMMLEAPQKFADAVLYGIRAAS